MVVRSFKTFSPSIHVPVLWTQVQSSPPWWSSAHSPYFSYMPAASSCLVAGAAGAHPDHHCPIDGAHCLGGLEYAGTSCRALCVVSQSLCICAPPGLFLADWFFRRREEVAMVRFAVAAFVEDIVLMTSTTGDAIVFLARSIAILEFVRVGSMTACISRNQRM